MPEASQNQYFWINEKSQKPSVLLWFGDIGPSSFGRFGDQNGDRRADRPGDTEKQRKCRPSGAQGRPKVPKRGPEGEGLLTHFRTIFLGRTMGARPRVPWAPRGGQPMVLPRLFGRLGNDFRRFFIKISSLIDRAIQKINPSIHASINQPINQSNKPSIHQ